MLAVLSAVAPALRRCEPFQHACPRSGNIDDPQRGSGLPGWRRRCGDRRSESRQPGAWKATNVSPNFTVHLYDQASHGADFLRVYVSKNGFNPATQRLGWGNLDFITQTGRYAPSQNISFNVSTSGYTGRHIVFVIWQASHMDQTYMWCSDVNFV
ncbi:lytic polysaccharide monooxygenase [Micromonospora echinaurantiaca]|uniref:lytic polysaccharide monooxygenase n=1 Tax=Micromonospora echinaurantiaca TaxID=47857 RepID=UPI00371C2958